jgi:hypothetical protein
VKATMRGKVREKEKEKARGMAKKTATEMART